MTGLMMAPVAVPWVKALQRTGGLSLAATWPFIAGYALTWLGFSATAAWVQVALTTLGVVVPFGLDGGLLSAAVLVLCGAFQLSTLKQACLKLCRSPAGFFLTSWRDGVTGRFAMGLRHGLHCVGCCWALMSLALVFGMVNLGWMVLLMVVMVAETALPFGAKLTRPIGFVLMLAGVMVWLR